MSIHEDIKTSDMFILYERVGPERGIYGSARDCANAIVVHPSPERLMVRGLSHGRQTFRMPAVDFGMTIFD
jgi:hypothetical protein